MASTINAKTTGVGGIDATGDASGVLALQTAGVTALSIDASQKVTFANSLTGTTLTGATFTTTPATTTAQSMVRLNTSNGNGSTNTVITRFTNTVTNQGTDITYADSATLGALFTINTNGVYAISYTDCPISQFIGMSLNSTQLTTSIGIISTTDRLCCNTTSGGNPTNTSWTGYLPSSSSIRPHGTTVLSSTPSQATFTIVRIA